VILAIDPGPERSAYVLLKNGKPFESVIVDNELLLERISPTRFLGLAKQMVIEGIESQGMAVGKETFTTCIWIGRFIEAWFDRRGETTEIIYRSQVKMHLCGNLRAKDTNIRQALIDRYGPGKHKAVGLVTSKGPLYGIKSHCWQALAVGVTYFDTRVES